MVDDAVDHRGSDGLVAEDTTPAAEGQVGCEDQRGVFVATGHELEEEVRGVLLEGQVADLVDLCGYPHRPTYAEPATMPKAAASGVVGLGFCLLASRHSYRASRNASTLSGGR